MDRCTSQHTPYVLQDFRVVDKVRSGALKIHNLTLLEDAASVTIGSLRCVPCA